MSFPQLTLTLPTASTLTQILSFPLHGLSLLLTHPLIKDALSLIILGAIAEGTRRGIFSIWEWLVDRAFITSAVKFGDDGYDWLYWFWLNDESWKERARNFQLETNYITGAEKKAAPWRDLDGPEDSAFDPQLVPKLGVVHHIKFQGRWFRFERAKVEDAKQWYEAKEELTISTMSHSKKPFIDLLLAARQKFRNRDAAKLVIKMVASESQGGGRQGVWGTTIRRHKRGFDTVIVEQGVKEMLIKDVQEFLGGEEWYVKRGIPWRRGYLLYGKPGTGKTSTIHALASEMGLEVYVVQLSASGMNDTKLNEAMVAVPQNSIVVMEDIDVATTSRTEPRDPITDTNIDEKEKTGVISPFKAAAEKSKKHDENISKVTLSGLLNSIDGIAGSEGRVLIMSTNHRDKLDPALIRPGRADLHIEYKYASKTQAKELFCRFYPLQEDDDASEKAEEHDAVSLWATTNASLAKLRWQPEVIGELSESWVDGMPEREFSVSALQGLLLQHKTSPQAAVDALPAWIETQREEAAEKAREEEAKVAAARAKAIKEKESKKKAKEEEDKKKEESSPSEVALLSPPSTPKSSEESQTSGGKETT